MTSVLMLRYRIYLVSKPNRMNYNQWADKKRYQSGWLVGWQLVCWKGIYYGCFVIADSSVHLKVKVLCISKITILLFYRLL